MAPEVEILAQAVDEEVREDGNDADQLLHVKPEETGRRTKRRKAQ